MRTTLTLDPDVAVELENLRRERDASLKQIANEAMRRGIAVMRAAKKRKPFRIKPFDGGKLLIDIDNAAEAIAIAEGGDYK